MNASCEGRVPTEDRRLWGGLRWWKPGSYPTLPYVQYIQTSSLAFTFLASLLQNPHIFSSESTFKSATSLSTSPVGRPLYLHLTYIGGCILPLSKMGFHFDAQGEVGEERSKTPKLQGQSYNYHAFLYSMSCKDSLPSQKHQSRLSLPALKRPPVPPRQSSLPVFAPTYSLPERIPSVEGRTVSSMNNVLPLQLQAGVRAGGFDFSSWIDSTIEELRHPFNSENPAHKRRSQSMKDVPWMQEEQDTTFDTLQPRKHRETAVYSDPGSTIVSFPYCGCEGLGSNQFHRHSARADLDAGLPCPLFSKTNTPRCSGATLVNPLDSHSDTGINTFGRARAVSSVSAISPQSQEERAVRAAWMKPLPSPPSPIIPRIGDIISPTMFSPTTTEGCSSMPCTPGLILDVSLLLKILLKTR